MSYFNSPSIITTQQEISSNPLPPATQQENNPYNSDASLNNYLRILKKYRLSSFFIFLSIIALTLLINHALVPRYVAGATMKIDTNPQQILEYGINAQQQQSRTIDPTFLETQYKLLRSRKLARSVINTLNLKTEQLQNDTFKPFVGDFFKPLGKIKQSIKDFFKFESSTQQLSETPEQLFLSQLTIRPVKNTQLVEILFSSKDPALSARIVNQLVDSFIAYNVDSTKETAHKAEQFLRTELLNARHKLQSSEKALLNYARQQNIINTGSDRSILEKNLEDLSTAYIKAKEQRIIAESIYQKKQNITAAVQSGNNKLISDLKSRLALLSSQYQEGLKTYKPQYPKMLAIKTQIRDVQQQIQRESRLLTSSVNNDLRTTFLSAQQQEKVLNGEIRKHEKKLLSFEKKNLHYIALQRETDTDRALYEGLLQRLKEVGVASGSGSGNIELIDSAVPPLQSHSPKKALNLAIGAILGLLLGIISAFLRDFMNNKISCIEDLERLNLPYPVLTTLPMVSNSEKKMLAQLAVDKPHSTLAEAIRYLYINLSQQVGGVPQLLHITSALPAEGKSSIVTNLAAILANSGKKVLIIDSDLRRPCVHKYLEIDNTVGLSNLLSGNIDTLPIQKVPANDSLFVMPAGPSVSDPVNLLSSQRMITLCDDVRNAYDHIILDSPPVLGLADSLVLSNRADATLFVVSRNKPKKKEILNALKNLDKGFANLIGVIFSKEKNTVTEYYSSTDYSDGRQALTWEEPIHKESHA